MRRVLPCGLVDVIERGHRQGLADRQAYQDQLLAVIEPELGLRRVPCRREGGRGAREPEGREQRARRGGVHDDGDHAATATARARQHVGERHRRGDQYAATICDRAAGFRSWQYAPTR